MTPPKVMIGMPVGSRSIPWETAVSLIATIRALDREKIKFKIESPTGASIVQWARSLIVGAFLRQPEYTHLFWIDSDIFWTPNDFFRILGFGAVHDVIGATYPFKKEPTGFLVNLAGEPGKAEVNGHGCVRINSMAIGFTLIKRAVIEKVAATKPIVNDPVNKVDYPDFFRVDRHPTQGTPRGEDVAFFDDAREAGFDCWLDPSVKLGHVGYKVYSGDPLKELGLDHYAKEVKS